MRRSFRLSSLFTAMALATAGCGSDGPTENSGDELTEAEMSEIATEMFAGMAGFMSGEFSARKSALLPEGLNLSINASVPINVTIDESGPCGGDGTFSVSGSVDGNVDDETGAGDIQLDITQGFTDCLIEGELHVYTVSGQPNLHMTGDFHSDGGDEFDATFALVGGFGFLVDDGREGTCGIDVTTTVSIIGTSVTATAQGTICGITVDNSVLFGG